MAASASGAPRVTTKSMLGSCFSLAAIVDCSDGLSAPFT
jgi:Ca2+/Na+ antiporter